MQRVGFLIRVKAEKLEEYKKIHAEVWPDLLAELKAAGMRNYSLWLRP
jgi:L-rhamnose mutarotase